MNTQQIIRKIISGDSLTWTWSLIMDVAATGLHQQMQTTDKDRLTIT